MTSPLALWYTMPRPTVVGQHNSSRQARELGTLRSTLVQPFAFSPWIPGCPGRNPRRRSGHRVVVRSCDRPNPHAALHPSGCGLSRLRHLPTLATHSTQIVYSQQAPFPSDWWLPLTAVNSLEPLPPSQRITAHRVLAASANAQSHWLHSTGPSTSPHMPLGDHTLTSQALASLSAS